MTDLEKLLNVTPDDILGILDKFNTSGCPLTTNPAVQFFYIRFQNDQPRLQHFIEMIQDYLPAFCLRREKLQSTTPHSHWRRLYREAKRKFAQLEDNKSGEPGELIVYLLLEGCLRVPKILSKMSLKTNSQMHVHGADGVHLGIDGSHIVLYFAESKLYSVHTTAITEALSSIKEFVSPTNPNTNFTKEDFEINVLSNDIDIPEGDLRNQVLEALDPYQAARSNLRYIYACFIGFDINELLSTCEAKNFQALYEKKAKSCYENLLEKITKDEVLNQLTWQFFFLPFGSVDDFRAKFFKEF